MKEIEVLLLSRDREYCKALARAFALENSKINLWIWIVHENKADLKKIMKAMKTELWQFNAINSRKLKQIEKIMSKGGNLAKISEERNDRNKAV